MTLFGGVFQMKYGHDCDIIASEGKLLQHLTQLGKVGPFSKRIP
jgi:hypothetical protein